VEEVIDSPTDEPGSGMSRPPVSLIVPFAGSDAELRQLKERLAGLELGPDDQILIADNRRGAEAANGEGVHVVEAGAIPTPAHARNIAARAAAGEWLVFIDADTVPDAALLKAYFDPAPRPRTAVLAGAIVDVAPEPTITARHAVVRARMSQRTTLDRTARPYVQTANCAVRGVAFDEVGGFDPHARAAEDADLSFRLQDAGWAVEERPGAVVRHLSRSTPAGLIRQLFRHGSGAAWANRRHPGTFPPPTALGLGRRLGHSAREALVRARHGDREGAAFALLDLAGACAFELGRLRSNLRDRLPDADAG